MGIHRELITTTFRAACWHVRSQEGARRNARVASTALTQRRRELLEVEEFLAHLGPGHRSETDPPEARLRSVR